MSKRWSKLCWDKRRWITELADGRGAGSQTGNKKTGNKSVKISINNFKYHFQPIFSREPSNCGRCTASPQGALGLPRAAAGQATASGQQGVCAGAQNPYTAARILPGTRIKKSFNTKRWKKSLLSWLTIWLSLIQQHESDTSSLLLAERGISSSLAGAH